MTAGRGGNRQLHLPTGHVALDHVQVDDPEAGHLLSLLAIEDLEILGRETANRMALFVDDVDRNLDLDDIDDVPEYLLHGLGPGRSYSGSRPDRRPSGSPRWPGNLGARMSGACSTSSRDS